MTNAIKILAPVSSIQAITEQFKQYELLKQSLLVPSDLVTIRGKTFIKKSWYRKLATAFGISIEITTENKEEIDWWFVRHITAKAIAPNGRFATCCASCASKEKELNKLENDVRATAQTRASNRAISDLIGAGEVSAEEIGQPVSQARPTTTTQITTTQDYWEIVEEVIADTITPAQIKFLWSLIRNKYKGQEAEDLLDKMPSMWKKEAHWLIKRLANLDDFNSK